MSNDTEPFIRDFEFALPPRPSIWWTWWQLLAVGIQVFAPLVVFVILDVINHDYQRMHFVDPLCRKMFLTGVALMLLGTLFYLGGFLLLNLWAPESDEKSVRRGVLSFLLGILCFILFYLVSYSHCLVSQSFCINWVVSWWPAAPDCLSLCHGG